MSRISNRLKELLSRIELVDVFLILFMAILLLYTTITLLMAAAGNEHQNTVDVIVRTSAASIFGYFVSSNFLKNAAKSSAKVQEDTNLIANDSNTDAIVTNKIGFETKSEPSSVSYGKAEVVEYNESTEVKNDKIQIIIVAVIGLCCLILLFVTKFCVSSTQDISSTVSQLRDFVAASIGFLVSCGRSK